MARSNRSCQRPRRLCGIDRQTALPTVATCEAAYAHACSLRRPSPRRPTSQVLCMLAPLLLFCQKTYTRFVGPLWVGCAAAVGCVLEGGSSSSSAAVVWWCRGWANHGREANQLAR